MEGGLCNYRYFTACLVLLALLITGKYASAAQHAVGGSQGWDESTDFASWSSGQTFKVGDTLVFKYTSGLHNVVELAGESAYKSCDITSSLNSMNGGSNSVKLDKAGTRYFACGTAGHCDQGMKVKITTVSGNSSSSTTPSSSSSSSTSTASAFNPLTSMVLAAAFLIFNLVFIML